MMYRLAAAYTVHAAPLRKQLVTRFEQVTQSDPEAGDAVQKAILTGGFALIAIGAVTLIGNAVMAKVHSITLDTPNLNTTP